MTGCWLQDLVRDELLMPVFCSANFTPSTPQSGPIPSCQTSFGTGTWGGRGRDGIFRQQGSVTPPARKQRWRTDGREKLRPVVLPRGTQVAFNQ